MCLVSFSNGHLATLNQCSPLFTAMFKAPGPIRRAQTGLSILWTAFALCSTSIAVIALSGAYTVATHNSSFVSCREKVVCGFLPHGLLLGQSPIRRTMALSGLTKCSRAMPNSSGLATPNSTSVWICLDVDQVDGAVALPTTARHAVGLARRKDGHSGSNLVAPNSWSRALASSPQVQGRLYGSPGFCLLGTQSNQREIL